MKRAVAFLMLVVPGSASGQFLPGETQPFLDSPRVDVEIAVDTNGVFEYSYSISNLATSTGAIWSIDIDVTRPPDSAAITREGVSNGPRFAFHTAQSALERSTMVPVGVFPPDDWIGSLRVDGFAGWGAMDEPFFILPGESLSGFRMISRGPPGIRQMILAPRFEMTPVESASLEDLERLLAVEKVINVSTLTVGPVAPPSLTERGLIDHLIDVKHQAFDQGWIFGEGSGGIVQGLDAKLDAAKASLERAETGPGKNQKNTASNQLRAFINQVEALRGKKLNDEAYFLLKVNAEFILRKLEEEEP